MKSSVGIEVGRGEQNVLYMVCIMHVLWECLAYRSCRDHFSGELQDLLGDSGMDFDQLSSREKTSYVLEIQRNGDTI